MEGPDAEGGTRDGCGAATCPARPDVGTILSTHRAAESWNILRRKFAKDLPYFHESRSTTEVPIRDGDNRIARLTSMAGSTLPQRSMGRRLLQLRKNKKLSQTAAGHAIEVSPQTIGRLEEGQPSQVGSPHLKTLLQEYEASEEDARIILALHQEVKAAQAAGGSWWRTYSDEIPSDFDHFLGLEEAANRITSWQTIFLPGLLQTAAYRRATIWTWEPALSSEAVEKRIELATKRQDRLNDPDLRVDAFLSEAVLRYEIGGHGVMEDQLKHLLEVSQLPSVSLRVVPFSARSILGLVVGPFTLMEFPSLQATKSAEPPVVYIEEYTGGLYLERDSDIRQYRNAVQEIERVAWSGQETRTLVQKLTKEYVR